jgi:hypothetical protein
MPRNDETEDLDNEAEEPTLADEGFEVAVLDQDDMDGTMWFGPPREAQTYADAARLEAESVADRFVGRFDRVGVAVSDRAGHYVFHKPLLECLGTEARAKYDPAASPSP